MDQCYPSLFLRLICICITSYISCIYIVLVVTLHCNGSENNLSSLPYYIYIYILYIYTIYIYTIYIYTIYILYIYIYIVTLRKFRSESRAAMCNERLLPPPPPPQHNFATFNCLLHRKNKFIVRHSRI